LDSPINDNANFGASCSDNGLTTAATISTQAIDKAGEYSLSFFKADGITPVFCTAKTKEIELIKSIGTFRNTVRAVNVSVGVNGNDAFVKLLLHANGLNAVFTDSSATPKVITAGGNVTQSNVQTKSGFDNSASFDGNGDYLQTPTSSDFNFNTGPFTIDTWFKLNDLAKVDQTIFNVSPSHVGIDLAYNVGSCVGRLGLWVSSNGTSWDVASCPSSAGIKSLFNTTDWNHVALVWDGSSYKVYVNGVLDINIASSVSVPNVDANVKIGYSNGGGGQYLNGYIDEFRVSKGIARWTNDFSADLPSRPY
jgi:hypothetical protein